MINAHLRGDVREHPTSLSLFLSATRGHSDEEMVSLQARKRAHTRNQICWHRDLGLPASRTVRM